ncbi:unnamed protein product [Haemonchus placei]|uniref:7TM_GPCR_Srx domain-containing protein n=1 Tax=Haemonchus placei TaxID=6290 RepID=A0A0N4W867_HAEPC|nr:unnamed protein product [Haemonchus placei]
MEVYRSVLLFVYVGSCGSVYFRWRHLIMFTDVIATFFIMRYIFKSVHHRHVKSGDDNLQKMSVSREAKTIAMILTLITVEMFLT